MTKRMFPKSAFYCPRKQAYLSWLGKVRHLADDDDRVKWPMYAGKKHFITRWKETLFERFMKGMTPYQAYNSIKKALELPK